MTFAEMNAEALVYPFSKDHYELVKECAEIDVMNAYIESYTFQQNNQSLMEGVQVIEENTFMFESTSEDEIKALQESVGEKIKNAWGSIIKRVKGLFHGLFKMLANVFDRLAKFFDPADKVAEKIEEIAADNSIPAEEKKKKIEDVVEIANKEAESLGVNFILVGEGKRHSSHNFIMRHKVKGSVNPPAVRKAAKPVLANAKKIVGDERKINNLICAFTHDSLAMKKDNDGPNLLGSLDGIAQVYVGYFGAERDNAVMANFPKDVNNIERILTVPMDTEWQSYIIKVLNEIMQDVAHKTVDNTDAPAKVNDGTNWSAVNAAATLYMNMIAADIAYLSNTAKFRANVMTKVNKYMANGPKKIEDASKRPITVNAEEVG